MLALTLPPGETVTIHCPEGDDIIIKNLDPSSYQRIGFEAPREYEIVRSNARVKHRKPKGGTLHSYLASKDRTP